MIDVQESDLSTSVPSSKARLILPPAPLSETGRVKIWSEPVEMLTYEPAQADPHPAFLEKRVYQGSSGRIYPLPVIDHVETTPVLRSWKAIHIENEFVRVMVLPEVGGRIHLALDKRTGYDFIYRQNVMKPALVGLAGPWASGGIEFNWPQHHRPATYMPVEVVLERLDDGSATIWCGDHDPMQRLKGMHGICLQPDRAVMEVKVRLYNRTHDTHTFLWWANVATHANESYQSFFPRDVQVAADHAKRAVTTYPLSTGTYYGINYGDRVEHGVPEREQPRCFIPDGSYARNDLGWFANIPVPTSYMIANSAGDYSGGYDHKRGAGTVAIGNHHIQPGKKQWTWGNHEFGYAWDRSLTDSDGPYVELMVGAYTDNQPDFSFLAPGETKTFSQYWYPISEIGVPDIAALAGALRVEPVAGGVKVHVQVTSKLGDAVVRVLADGKEVDRWQGDLNPNAPLHYLARTNVDAASLVVVVEERGEALLRYAPAEIVLAEPLTAAEEPAAPAAMTSVDELFLTGLHLEQYRHPTRTPEAYWLEAVRRDPGDSRCNHALGRFHLRRGEFDVAEKYLLVAVARLQRRNPNPYDGEPFYNLGLTRLYLDKEAQAYDAFYKATWNAAWTAPAYHRLAEIDCRRKDWTTALDHLERSLARNVDNLNARNLKVVVLRRKGRSDEADAELAAIVAMDPLDIFSRYLRDGSIPSDGQLCLDLCLDLLTAGLTDDALRVLEGATEKPQSESTDGSHTILLYLHAQVLRRQGMKEAAGEAARLASAASPAYVFPHRLEEMLLVEDALRNNPEDAHAHQYLGNLLYDKRRHEEAMRHWERSIRLDAANSIVWRNLAVGYYNIRHDHAAALDAFQHARQLSPGDARLLYEYDQLLVQLRTFPAERLALFEADWSLVARRDDLSVQAASLLNSVSRAPDALALLLSHEFQPWEGGEGAALGQYMRAHLLIAIQHLRRGEHQIAIQHLREALQPPRSLSEAPHVLQNLSAIYYWLGLALEQAGDTASAQRSLTQAASARGDFQQMEVKEISDATFWTGMAMKRLGRNDEAVELFHRVLRYADELDSKPAVIDFFATSLPNLLLFEADIDERQKISALFFRAQAKIGLEDQDGVGLLQSVLEKDPNHTGAIDLLKIQSR